MRTTFRTFCFVACPTLMLMPACSQGPTPAETATTAEELSIGALGSGAVFTQTNASEHNELIAFVPTADGTLAEAGRFDTGGAGLGTGLNAQGALARKGRWLFVVNAGSNDLSTFDLASGRPALVSRTPTGGMQPVSVTARAGLVYVLNAGGAGNITGSASTRVECSLRSPPHPSAAPTSHRPKSRSPRTATAWS